MITLRFALFYLVANSVSAFNSYMAYLCVVSCHEVFAVMFLLMAVFTSVSLNLRAGK